MSTNQRDERSDEMRDPTKDDYLELETELGTAESTLAAGIAANDKASKDAMAAAREHTKSALGDIRRSHGRRPRLGLGKEDTDSARRGQMFITRSQQSPVRFETLETWRAAARLVSDRWDRFLHADPEMRVFAFASYVAALDCEQAAAADLAALARPAAA